MFRIDKRAVNEDSPAISTVKTPSPIMPDGKHEEVTPPVSSTLDVMRAKLADAHKELEQTKEEIRNMLFDAQREAESIRYQAEQDGFRQGIENAKAEYTEKFNELSATAEMLVDAHYKAYDEIELSVMELAMIVANKVLFDALANKPEAFEAIVHATLDMVKAKGDLKMYVSHHEYERFFKDASSPLAQTMINSGVTVIEDLSLEMGACCVHTDYGTVDTGVKTQMRRLYEALGELE